MSKKTYDFTLIIEGPDIFQEEISDALYEAGCDDATLGSDGVTGSADFSREAPSFDEAVFSAIEDIESVRPLRVVSIEQDDLVTAAELGRRSGRSRESIRLLANGKRGPGGFPKPIHWPSERQSLWLWSEVVRWFADTLNEKIGDPQREEFLAALNAQLEARRRTAKLGKAERKAMQALAA